MSAMVSQGVVLKIGDGATPTEVFNAIGQLVSVSGIGSGSASEIDVTHLGSSAKEFLLGIRDEGEVSVTLNLDTGDTYQTQLRTARDNNALTNFEFDLTDAGPTTISFAAYVKTFGIGAAVDDKLTLEVALRISGAATWA